MNILASPAQLRASFLRWALFMVPLVLLIGFTAGQLGGPDTPWFAGLVKPAIFPPPTRFRITAGMWQPLAELFPDPKAFRHILPNFHHNFCAPPRGKPLDGLG